MKAASSACPSGRRFSFARAVARQRGGAGTLLKLLCAGREGIVMGMDGRCKTCRWWDHGNGVDCVFIADHHYCLHESNGENIPSGMGHEVQYGSYPGSYCKISTGPDFGCVHWKAIEEPSHA